MSSSHRLRPSLPPLPSDDEIKKIMKEHSINMTICGYKDGLIWYKAELPKIEKYSPIPCVVVKAGFSTQYSHFTKASSWGTYMFPSQLEDASEILKQYE
jgi:hypothetical protein